MSLNVVNCAIFYANLNNSIWTAKIPLLRVFIDTSTDDVQVPVHKASKSSR